MEKYNTKIVLGLLKFKVKEANALYWEMLNGDSTEYSTAISVYNLKTSPSRVHI
jgi:hypothetical protein